MNGQEGRNPDGYNPGQEKNSGQRLDKIAIVMSLLSLLFSGFSLYLTEYRSAEINVTVGQKALISARPKIALVCTFTNGGVRQQAITSASLQCDNITLDWELTSSTLDQWEFDDAGGMKVVERARYTPSMAPISVKGHDQSSAILWFTGKEFDFAPRKHKCSMRVRSEGKDIASSDFNISLTKEDSEFLKDPKNSATELTVSVLWDNKP